MAIGVGILPAPGGPLGGSVDVCTVVHAAIQDDQGIATGLGIDAVGGSAPLSVNSHVLIEQTVGEEQPVDGSEDAR